VPDGLAASNAQIAHEAIPAGMNRKPAIDTLLNTTPQLWKGRQFSRRQRTLPTGHARLDARLPGRGWPLGAVTELISKAQGLGEFSLLFPVLANLAERGQWIVLIDPPCIPYPASLQANGLCLERLLLVRTRNAKESLWACEQALSGTREGAVLVWPKRIGFVHLRRLQLAAEANTKLSFLFRSEDALSEPSPAALRLQLQAGDHHGLRISVVKCRGGRPPEPVWVARSLPGFEKPSRQTLQHDLACSSITAPEPGPVHPGPRSTQAPDCAERYH
jgi:hypothetical protein